MKHLIGALVVLSATPAVAQTLGGPMKHLLISQIGQDLSFSFETTVDGPLEFQDPTTGFPGVASVLDGAAYNAQFGWLASGFFSLPASTGVFVRAVEQSAGLRVYDAFSFDPILGTQGSDDVWQWSGVMTHNWYAAEAPGFYNATYVVYVGNLAGNALEGWGSTSVSLSWIWGLQGPSLQTDDAPAGPVPTPGALAMISVGLTLSARRRR